MSQDEKDRILAEAIEQAAELLETMLKDGSAGGLPRTYPRPCRPTPSGIDRRLMMTAFTPHQSTFFAHRITLEGLGEQALAQSLSTARVDMNPHQVDAALFALASPLSKGVVLADEVGLGKTIEAALVIAQRWAERRRRILLIVPASLRKQWSQELAEKFSLPSVIIESKGYKDAKKKGVLLPFDNQDRIVITSYEFAASKAAEVARVRLGYGGLRRGAPAAQRLQAGRVRPRQGAAGGDAPVLQAAADRHPSSELADGALRAGFRHR